MYKIAIDGPAAAGKSTLAKKIAKELGYVYVDTGAMYRAMGLYLLRKGITPDDLTEVPAYCSKPDISVNCENGVQIIYLDGENVNGLIRTEEIGKMASAIGVVSEVRQSLVTLQQKIASEMNVVMDGRDIGTCVLPDAQVKFYLTAPIGVRAGRRYLELIEKGVDADLETVRKDMMERDYRDMNRAVSPLRQAPDALFIDTMDMDPDQVLNYALDLIVAKVNGRTVAS